MRKLLLYLMLGFFAADFIAVEITAQGLEDESQNHRKWQKRRKMRLDAYRDENGRVRPDLWKKGIEQFQKMRIDAGRSVAPSGPKGNGGVNAALGYSVTGVQWTQIGPQPAFPIANINFQGNGPMSGEVLDIAIDPRGTYDRVIYIATNSGGIWRSVDGGETFEPKTDYMPSLSMGAVALDPGNPSIVYAGTGNLFDGNGNRFAGPLSVKAVGVYKSIDMGETWSILNPGGIFNGVGINRIVFPEPGVLLVGTSSGVFRSVDGGVNFGSNAPMFDNGSAVRSGFISDLDLDVADPSIVYASVSGTGLFMSTDGGVTFPTNLFSNTNGAPLSFQFVALAQAESFASRMYASVQSLGGSFQGLYRSVDGGLNWEKQDAADAAGADNNGCQCGYDQTVGVDPLDEDIVFIGFQELYRSTDGGGTFSTNDVSRNKIHWDHHAITFSPPGHRGSMGDDVRMWIGTDGGLHSSDNYNEGSSVAIVFNNDHNITIATNLFTDIDIGTSGLMGDSGAGIPNASYTYGGTQDTGTLHHNSAIGGTLWNMGVNGDGGGVGVDTEDAQRVYGGGNNGCIYTDNGGATWTNTCPKPEGEPRPDPGFLWRYAVDFNDPMVVWAIQATNAGFDPGNNLFRSNDRGLTWTEVAAFNPGPTNVWAIANTPTDSNVLWFGLTDGNVYYTTNALSSTPSFSYVTVPAKPGGGVSAVAINPLNSDEVVITYRNVCGGPCSNANNRQRRVFRTTDGGSSWQDISGTDGNPIGNLPNLPMNSVVYDTGTTPPTIIVSNDAGVLKTSNSGQTWEIFGYGLPTVEGSRLRIDNSTSPGLLRLGTYGRSVLELTAAQGPILAVNADLGFGTFCLGDQSTRIVQLFNVGSEDLVINAVFRAEGSTNFQVIGPSTPAVIRPGEELDFTIKYTASSPGDQTAVFQINSTDQFFPSKQIFASATGNTQMISTLIAAGGVFADTCTDSFSDLNLTIANVGCGFLEVGNITSSSAEFGVATVSNFPLTIEEGNSISIPIRFEPDSNSPCGGIRSANLTIASDDPTTPNKIVDVEGFVPCPDLNVAIANSGSFGAVCEGSQADLDLTLFNQGACNLTISDISLSGLDSGDFALPDDLQLPLVLSPDADFTVPVRFQPDPAKSCSDDTPREADITITSDSPDESPLVIPISGLVPCPNLVIDPAGLEGLYAFPATVVDTTGSLGCFTDRQVTLRNTGACPLIIDGIDTGGDADFSVIAPTLFPIELPPGEETLSVTVRFTPQTGGEKRVADEGITGLLTVAVDDIPDGSADLCGEGVVQGGARFLVTDVSSGTPVVISPVEDIRVSSKGKNTPSPYSVRYTNAEVVDTTMCGNPLSYHMDLEELATGGTTGNNPKASYEVSAKNGNLQTKQSFSISQCDFLQFQLQLTTESGGGKGKGGKP